MRPHHTGFIVTNREQSIAFYRDAVGLELLTTYERRGPAIDQVVGYPDTHLRSAMLALPGGGHILELIQYAAPAPEARGSEERSQIGAAHLALEVDDIDGAFRRLQAGGARIMNPPAELEPGLMACYLQDPDGNWLEIFHRAKREIYSIKPSQAHNSPNCIFRRIFLHNGRGVRRGSGSQFVLLTSLYQPR